MHYVAGVDGRDLRQDIRQGAYTASFAKYNKKFEFVSDEKFKKEAGQDWTINKNEKANFYFFL